MESDERIVVEGKAGITCRRTSSGRVRFEISVNDDAGNPQYLTVAGGLARAEAALAALAASRASAHRGIDLTFKEALERWLESFPVGTRERQDYEWPVHVHLIPRLGHLRIGEIGEWHAIALLDELRASGYTLWSLRTVLEPMRETMRFAIERGLRSDDPLSTVDVILDEETRPVEIEVEGCRVVDIRRFRATQAST
ncbi:MAG: hypothetical protein ACR2OD_05355 [Gaiellaceae bacterium]